MKLTRSVKNTKKSRSELKSEIESHIIIMPTHKVLTGTNDRFYAPFETN